MLKGGILNYKKHQKTSETQRDDCWSNGITTLGLWKFWEKNYIRKLVIEPVTISFPQKYNFYVLIIKFKIESLNAFTPFNIMTVGSCKTFLFEMEKDFIDFLRLSG